MKIPVVTLLLAYDPLEKPFELKLKYVPANVDDPKSFILPLKLKGYNHEIEGLKRRIKAVG